MTTLALPANLRARCAELICPELAPMLRRLGARDRGAGASAALHPEDAATREGVWAALVDFGALAENPQAELVELVELTGWALLQSPLSDTWFGADLLAGSADPAYDPLLHAAADGTATLAVATRAEPGAEPAAPGPLEFHPGATVSAARSVVAFASDAGHLLLVGTEAGHTRLAVVATTGPGVTVRRHDDIGRGDLYEVTADHAPIVGAVHDITAQYPAALARARIRHAAYLAGSARGAVELAARRLRERSAFGQPLARMQALAHRFAALSARAAAVLSSARAAARAADAGEDVRLAGAQVLLLAGVLAQEAAAECVHVHGAYGLTEGCDAQLYHRRAVVDAPWLGGTVALRREAGRLLAATRRPPR